MTRPLRQAGFTLIEVLIAATLLAVMMTLLLGSLRIGVRSWESGERRTADMNRMLTTQNFLRSHLSSTLPLRQTTAPGADPDPSSSALLFDGGPDRLAYAGSLPPQVRGGLYRFELYTEEHDDIRDLKLSIQPVYQAAGGSRGNEEGSIEDVTLVENLADLRIAYLASAQADQPAEWQSEWRQPVLPALIRIEIALKGSPPWPPLTIAPRSEARQ
ncbi:prepilin-type N-terminal cleavage/methylation domain-containing protein [Methylococcus sp. EFPC2]|uniref:prepilin-type N-terminal cleavage/methylation domain-containing protein n=1 Tax=Methylococcus sp. EFPC2 TaxID=2812648 RepID=UPI001967D805|nr:prepilin-type N-terminal cleavage/methylation domain-containing protein [Methylococcus sp. EFPC2]QSA96706.1 prepilin-type N-terminal cleavage/methylation domain-containing protein [Methylococcus sp. EFPC2]